ncbi:MAG: Cof-type HAD-IIB family hydrolase [Chloroflexota bacterium]|nr:Cof-type HAD-IIB family hydrolase [Chloroflexota bacterium]
MPDPRFPIRLRALDLDGTLIGPDLSLWPRTRSAILAAVRSGVHVSLATGRMPTSAQPFATELGLHDPIIAYQGALVRAAALEDRRLGRLIYHRPLPADVARETIRWTRERGFAPHLNHLERFIIPAGDPRTDDYSAFLGARAEIVPDLERWIRRPVSKVLAVGPTGAPLALLAAARAHFAGRAAVTVSHPEFLEFLAPGVSKGQAVRWLARRLRIPLEQTLAIGDQYNDLEMISATGHGVAMPSAPPAVQAAARYVAPPLADEGAAEVIELLVLAGRAAPGNAGRLQPGGAGELVARPLVRPGAGSR